MYEHNKKQIHKRSNQESIVGFVTAVVSFTVLHVSHHLSLISLSVDRMGHPGDPD